MQLFKTTLQRLIKTGIMSGVAIVACLALYIGVHQYGSSLEEDQRRARKQLANTIENVAEQRRIHEESQKALEIYRTLRKSHGNRENFQVNRKTALKMLNQFKEHYMISGQVSVSMTPLREHTHPKLKKDRFILESSNIEISFKGLTDNYVFGFLEAIKQKFPGFVHLRSIEIERFPKPFEHIMATLPTQDMLPGITQTKLQFTWFGLREIQKDSAERKEDS